MTVNCSNCNYLFDNLDTESGNQTPCPVCGSTDKTVTLEVHGMEHIHVLDTINEIEVVMNSAPPISFGAVVTVERKVPDGEIIKFLDPYYTQLLDAIRKDPDFIYQIDHRRWEEVIAASYDEAGFDEVILTPRSGDLGRDVIAVKKGFGSVKFIDQVKAYKPGHLVTADEVRALLSVVQAEHDVSKGIFTTTSEFAPRIVEDRFIKPFLPTRLELINKDRLLERLLDLQVM